MLSVTPEAGAHITKIMDEEDFPQGVAIRIKFEEQSLIMEPDHFKTSDLTIEHEGRVILLMDDQISQLLNEETLDLEGDTLTMRNDEDADGTEE